MMFKIIILQKYYNLSDEQIEFQLKEKKLSNVLFELFTAQLLSNSMVARESNMINRSFVDVPRQRNSCKDNTDIKASAVPLEFAKKMSIKNGVSYVKKILMPDG